MATALAIWATGRLGLTEKVWSPKKVSGNDFKESDQMIRLPLDPVLVGIVANTSDEGVSVGAVTFTQGFFTLYQKDAVEKTASVTFSCDAEGNISGESDSASGSRGGRNVEVEVAVKTEGRTAKVAYAAGASWKGSIMIEGGAMGLKVKITEADLSIKRSKTGTWDCKCIDKNEGENLTPAS